MNVHENHRRAIATTLALLDEMLCDFERWAETDGVRAVLFEQPNSLSAEQRQALTAEIAAIRSVLHRMRDDLQLEPRRRDTATAIWSRASAFREHLVELQGKYLRQYGWPSPALVAYLEPKAAELTRRLAKISQLAASQLPKPPLPAGKSPNVPAT